MDIWIAIIFPSSSSDVVHSPPIREVQKATQIFVARRTFGANLNEESITRGQS